MTKILSTRFERCAPGGWNNGVRHSNDVLQARANVKNNKYKDVYGIVHKAFAPAIAGMSGQIHADFLRLLWVLADKQMRSYYESMGKEDKIGTEAFRWARAKVFNCNKTSSKEDLTIRNTANYPNGECDFLEPRTTTSVRGATIHCTDNAKRSCGSPGCRKR